MAEGRCAKHKVCRQTFNLKFKQNSVINMNQRYYYSLLFDQFLYYFEK